MYIDLQVKYQFFVSNFNISREIFERKKTRTLNFMKIHSVGAEFHAGWRSEGWTNKRMDTHMTKLLFALRDFSNAPKNLHKDMKENGKPDGYRPRCSCHRAHTEGI